MNKEYEINEKIINPQTLHDESIKKNIVDFYRELGLPVNFEKIDNQQAQFYSNDMFSYTYYWFK